MDALILQYLQFYCGALYPNFAPYMCNQSIEKHQ